MRFAARPAHTRCRSCPGSRSRTRRLHPRSTKVSWCTSLDAYPRLCNCRRTSMEWRALARDAGWLCRHRGPGRLSAAVVARHVVMRIEAVGHSGRAVLSNGQDDTATLRWCTATACPESNAVDGCEFLISKRHCVRSRFRTVLKSGSRLSVAACAAAFSAPRGVFRSRRVCSEHGR